MTNIQSDGENEKKDFEIFSLFLDDIFLTREDRINAFFDHYCIHIAPLAKKLGVSRHILYRMLREKGSRKRPLSDKMVNKINAYFGTKF